MSVMATQSPAGAIGLGLIGLGGFGHYALQHFQQIAGVRAVCMTETHRPASLAAAKRFGLENAESVEAVVQRDDVDLVYISTPPFLHYPQALAALRAGKHVICEKPLALTVEQADELIAEAHSRRLLIIANLMQRYNPLYEMVRRVIESRALGEVLHGFFENYASDEALSASHWFWDRAKSGGIFIEHGVHFFDMFEGWLGAGEVVAAQRTLRAESNLEEQVQCQVRYPNGVMVNMYHGFTQPSRMDRQELRLLFERGDITLHEWVPTRAEVRAIADEESTRALVEIFRGSGRSRDGSGGCRLDIDTMYSGRDRSCQGRHKAVDVYQRFCLTFDENVPKYYRYGELLRAMIEDQIAWIRDPQHERLITEVNGRESLRMAVAATRLAQ